MDDHFENAEQLFIIFARNNRQRTFLKGYLAHNYILNNSCERMKQTRERKGKKTMQSLRQRANQPFLSFHTHTHTQTCKLQGNNFDVKIDVYIYAFVDGCTVTVSRRTSINLTELLSFYREIEIERKSAV